MCRGVSEIDMTSTFRSVFAPHSCLCIHGCKPTKTRNDTHESHVTSQIPTCEEQPSSRSLVSLWKWKDVLVNREGNHRLNSMP